MKANYGMPAAALFVFTSFALCQPFQATTTPQPSEILN